MEWGLLAQTHEQSAASAIGLAVLSSCVLLVLYRPRKTELAGTPHDVPFSAIVVALGWIMLMMSLQLEPSAQEGTRAPTLFGLWITCCIEFIQLVIPAAAYLLPRSVAKAAENYEAAELAFRQQEGRGQESSVPPAQPVARPRFVPADWPQHMAVGVTVGLASLLPTGLMAVVLTLLAGDADPERTHVLLKAMDGHGWNYVLPITLIAAVLAPLKEELLFRVILQGWFADRVGKLAIVLCALIFAVVHGYPSGILLVPLAFILGTMYESRRSYLEVVAVHATFNAVNLFAKANGLG